jgi:hypothetical protein
MIPRLRLVFACLIMVAAAASRASAQEPPAPAEEGRFRLGPLRFTPSIALTNLGVDDNVFNDDLDPKQDTTAAVGPAVKLWMHVGKSLLTGQVSAQYLYFRRYDNQRTWNTTDELKWEFPLGRLTPFIAGSYMNTKERPGFEIDSRAHQRADAVRLGTSVRLSGVTSLVLTGTRTTTAFDEGETFLGADLARALNGTSQTEAAQLRFNLTPLTTLVVGGEALQDRFKFDPIRNANSIRVLPGFELKPSALISGKVLVGFRRFDALSRAVPDYTGLAAAVDATYVAGSTRFAVRVARDLSFSFEETDPYYALTDMGLVITERVTRVWDLVARGGRQTLDYKRLTSVTTALSPLSYVIRQYGGGLGYRVGQTLRLGFDAVYYRRNSSQIAQRDFKGLRYGASISYGLAQ